MGLQWTKDPTQRHRYTSSGKHRYVIDISKKEDRYYLEKDGERILDTDTGEWKQFFYLDKVKKWTLQFEPLFESQGGGGSTVQPGGADQRAGQGTVQVGGTDKGVAKRGPGRPRLTSEQRAERDQALTSHQALMKAQRDEKEVIGGSPGGPLLTNMDLFRELYFLTALSVEDPTQLTRAFCPICERTFIRDKKDSRWDRCPTSECHQGILKSKVIDKARVERWPLDKKMSALRQVDRQLEIVVIPPSTRDSFILLSGILRLNPTDEYSVKIEGPWSPFSLSVLALEYQELQQTQEEGV